MKIKDENIRENSFGGPYVLTAILLSIFLLALIPSCTHDPFSPLDPDPVDTTGNPVDTTSNPVDTTGQDTTFIRCDSTLVYFNQEILPILNSNCAKSGCHDAITHEEGLVLTSYENVMSKGIVKAFNPNGSKLYKAIIDNDPDDVMPPPPGQKLSADQIALISKWIQQGAKDTTCVETFITCDTSQVTYVGFVAPLLSTFCVGCHSGSNPSGGILLNTYASVKTMAANGRLVGAISWANGYTKMPQNGNQLSACSISKIKAWIHDGMPNN